MAHLRLQHQLILLKTKVTLGANLNDKSQVIHTGMGMDGAMMPSMQRVFVGNGANVPQMQAIPTTQATQQSSEGAAKQPSATSSCSQNKK
jgi:hypothetical protein